MAGVVRVKFAGLLCVAALFTVPLLAQNLDLKSVERGKIESTKDISVRTDEGSEAGRASTDPAARAECAWLGERAVGLMWRDDLDTAFRHLDLYDRFGCPGEHIQFSFRCVVRQGNIEQKDQKSTDAFNARVRSCWVNPSLAPIATTTGAEKSGSK